MKQSVIRWFVRFYGCFTPVLLLLLTISGCAFNPVTGRSEFSLRQLSSADEVELGMRLFPVVIQQMGGEVRDLQLQGYVQRVGKLLADASHRPGVDYQFRVVNQPLPNAFALPGGYIVVTRGLLAQLENEAQLAAVLGHEIAHVAAGHAVQVVQHGQPAQLAAMLLKQATDDERDSRPSLQAEQLGAELLESSFSMDQEREADRLGIDNMVSAGYDPQGAIGLQEFYYRKLDRQPEPDWLNNLFRTHPFSKQRLENSRRYVQEHYAAVAGSSGAYLGKEKFTAAIRYVCETEPGYQLYRQALAQEEGGDPNQAIQTLDEALNSAPDEALIHTAIGLVYLRQEDLLSARRYFKQAVALDSDYYRPQLGLGYVHLKREEFALAVRELTRSNELLDTAQGEFLLAEALAGEGRRDEAAEHYRSVIAVDRDGKLGQVATQRLSEMRGH